MYSIEERSIGEIFKQVRAEKKITISQVEAETKVRKKFLEAIEEENFSALPNVVAAKGFMRLYANFLGIDPEKIINKFVDRQDESRNIKKEDERKPDLLDSSRKPRRIPVKFAAVIISFLIVIVLFYSGYKLLKNHFASRPSPKAVETKEVSPVVKEVLPEKVLLSADFVDRTWISVELDGKEAFTGVVGRGQKMFWEADKRIKIKAGNAGGVKVAVNEKPLGLLGAKGSVVEKEFSKQK